MPFLNLEWTSNRIQFFGEVDLFSVLSGLLYRNEWSSISGILIYSIIRVQYKMLNVWLFLICYNIKAEDLIDELGDFILKNIL